MNFMSLKNLKPAVLALTALVAFAVIPGCSSDRAKNQAKESAARYWQDKAYPGKSYDVQVIEAEKVDGGQWRVKGIVDGETRVGTFSPETETFSEGYYSLAHERSKRIAELEQESKYWKEKAEALEKDIFKLKVELKLARGQKVNPDAAEDDTDATAVVKKKPAPKATKTGDE